MIVVSEKAIIMRQYNLLTLITLTVYVQFLFPVNVFSQDTMDFSTKSDTTDLIYASSYLNFNNDQLSKLPFRNLSTFGLMAPSAYRLKGDRMFYYSIETTGDHTFIDGMQVADAIDFPVRIIQSYSLYPSQTPINKGFATGAITSIETLTQLNDFTVLIDVNSDQSYGSQGVIGEIFINIPFTSEKRKTRGRLVPSLLIAGSYSWTNNTDPVWERTQKLKNPPSKKVDLDCTHRALH